VPDKTTSLAFPAVTTSTGRKVEGFTSKFASDADASAAISADPKATEFAKGLVADLKKWGDSFSAARRFWLHKVASEGAKPSPSTPLLDSEHLVSVGDERFLIEGEVISTKWKANPFAPRPTFHGGWIGSANDETLKMTVRLADGNRVWGTVPAPLVEAVENGKTLVRITAKVSASEDENFGFFSFPKVAPRKEAV